MVIIVVVVDVVDVGVDDVLDVVGCIVVVGFGIEVVDGIAAFLVVSTDVGLLCLFCTSLFLTSTILGAAKISEKERGTGVTL